MNNLYILLFFILIFFMQVIIFILLILAIENYEIHNYTCYDLFSNLSFNQILIVVSMFVMLIVYKNREYQRRETNLIEEITPEEQTKRDEMIKQKELHKLPEVKYINIEEGKQCLICSDNIGDCAISPCGHYGFCESCLQSFDPYICSFCKKEIGGVLRVYAC